MASQLPLSQAANRVQGLARQSQSLSAPLTSQVKTSTQQLSEVASGTNNLLNSGFANFNKFANEVDSELSDFSTKLTDTIEGIVSPVQQTILETTTAIDVGLGGTIVNAQSVAKNISDNIGSSINSIVAQVPAIGEINSFANQLNGSIANVSNTINNVGGVISGVSGVISGATSGISSSINNIGGAISDITGSGVGVAEGLSDAIGGVTGKIGGAISGLSAPFDEVTQTVTDFNSNLTGGLQKINDRISNVTSTLDDINTFLTDPGAIIQGKLDELIDAGIAKVMEPINQLVNFGYNLANEINSATDIVTQEISSLTQSIGGIFTGTSALLNNALNSSDFFQENNLSYADGEVFQTENGPKLLSPLRRFNHYNYIITLGILNPKEYNNPNSYRDSGFSRVILQSSGGAYDRRIRTFEEGNNNMEYYIEDLEIDAVIAPNPNTGVALGTTINFKVIEPYSMGKFIESIVLGAEETGHKQYMQAPYCLKIDFVGWDETGQQSKRIQRSKYVPIMFTKMDFDVTEEGSTYTIEAVSYNESALDNKTNESKASIESSGRVVHEVLETDKNSVGRNLSSRIEKLEDDGQIKGGDRYIICFPKTKTALYEAARGLGTTSTGLTDTAEEELASDTGSQQETVDPDNPPGSPTLVEVVYNAAPETYQYLKSWANDEANINVIGKSPVWDDSRATDRITFPSGGSAWVEETQTFDRTNAEVKTEGRSRVYNWHEGTRVSTMIEDVLMSSKYLEESPSEEREIPFIKWFRIETMVFLERDDDAECQNGRPRRTYVYAVHPYYVDEAKIIAPNQAPKGNEILKQKALKEYNYLYTGKNEDILDFNLNFNQAFYQNILASYSQGPETGKDQQTIPDEKQGSKAPETPCRTPATGEILPELVEVVDTRQSRGGTEYEAGRYGVKRRIAESVHETIINSPINMVTADMEIWGDPYFIPTEQGNYSAKPAGPSLTQDSTMNYMNNEVLCIINFRSPLDYKINGFVMNMPELVKPFSGVFQVWAVTNKFSQGQFTQTLKLIRRSNQNSEQTGTRGHHEEDSERNIKKQPGGQPSADSATAESAGIPEVTVTELPGQSFVTPLTIPDSGAESLLPPRSVDQIVNDANAALESVSQSPSLRPPVSSIRAPEIDLPNVDLGGRTRFNTETGRFESGF